MSDYTKRIKRRRPRRPAPTPTPAPVHPPYLSI